MVYRCEVASCFVQSMEPANLEAAVYITRYVQILSRAVIEVRVVGRLQVDALGVLYIIYDVLYVLLSLADCEHRVCIYGELLSDALTGNCLY